MASVVNINGTTFEKKDGKIFLNGIEVIENRMTVKDACGYSAWQIAAIFFVCGFAIGYFL